MRPNQLRLQKKPAPVGPAFRPLRGKSAISRNCVSPAPVPRCCLDTVPSAAGDNDSPELSPIHHKPSMEVEEEPAHHCPKETTAGWKRTDVSLRTTSAIRLRKIHKLLDETIKIPLHQLLPGSSVASYHDESVKVPLGFPNLGNTCFFNSALMALYSLSAFRQFSQSVPLSAGPVSTLLRLFCQQNPAYYNREDVARGLLALIEGFHDGRQHCSYSFILHLLASLDTELRSEGKVSRPSDLTDSLPLERYRAGKCAKLHDIFSILTENLFICSKCKANLSFSNYSYGRTMDLPVPKRFQSFRDIVTFGKDNFYLTNSHKEYISKDNLKDYLAYFGSQDTQNCHYPLNSQLTLSTCFDYSLRATLMTVGNELPCVQCGNTRHYKQPFLRHLGSVLVLHFQRYDESNADKLETMVPFEEILDLSPYISSGNSKYDLKAVIYHDGTLYFGHYTATIRLNGAWYSFNDEQVSMVPGPVAENAYLLFYEARICR